MCDHILAEMMAYHSYPPPPAIDKDDDETEDLNSNVLHVKELEKQIKILEETQGISLSVLDLSLSDENGESLVHESFDEDSNSKTRNEENTKYKMTISLRKSAHIGFSAQIGR